MPGLRKRPCSICRKWFYPDPRVEERQHVCSKAECQAARRKRTQANWRAKNPEYAAGYRIQQRNAQERPPEALRLPAPLPRLPWDLAKDEFGRKGADFIALMGGLLVRLTKDQFRSYHADSTSSCGVVPDFLAKDQSPAAAY